MILGGKKRFEYTPDRFLVHANAGIVHLNNRPIASAGAQRDRDLPTIRYRIAAVYYSVHQNLPQLG